MRITRVIVKCIIILVVLFLLSLGESIIELIASNINGDLFIGCILWSYYCNYYYVYC